MKVSFHQIDWRLNKSGEIKSLYSLQVRDLLPVTSPSSCCPCNKHHSKSMSLYHLPSNSKTVCCALKVWSHRVCQKLGHMFCYDVPTISALSIKGKW